MNWARFTEATPELAELGRERFARHDLCLVGTLRRDGSPRISPCELDLVADAAVQHAAIVAAQIERFG